MLRLALRTLPLFAVIASIAVALGAYMNFSGVRSAYVDLIQSRLGIIADDVERDILSAVSVGIPITEQITLPELLARQAGADKAIVSIDVDTSDGVILFSSVGDRHGARHQVDGSTFDVRRQVLNDFGASLGSVVVRYDRKAMVSRIDGFADSVMVSAIPAGIGAMLAGSLAAFLIVGRLYRRASALARDDGQDAVARAQQALAAVENGAQGNA